MNVNDSNIASSLIAGLIQQVNYQFPIFMAGNFITVIHLKQLCMYILQLQNSQVRQQVIVVVILLTNVIRIHVISQSAVLWLNDMMPTVLQGQTKMSNDRQFFYNSCSRVVFFPIVFLSQFNREGSKISMNNRAVTIFIRINETTLNTLPLSLRTALERRPATTGQRTDAGA